MNKKEIKKVIKSILLINCGMVEGIDGLAVEAKDLVEKIVFHSVNKCKDNIQNEYAKAYEKYLYMKHNKRNIDNYEKNIRLEIQAMDIKLSDIKSSLNSLSNIIK